MVHSLIFCGGKKPKNAPDIHGMALVDEDVVELGGCATPAAASSCGTPESVRRVVGASSKGGGQGSRPAKRRIDYAGDSEIFSQVTDQGVYESPRAQRAAKRASKSTYTTEMHELDEMEAELQAWENEDDGMSPSRTVTSTPKMGSEGIVTDLTRDTPTQLNPSPRDIRAARRNAVREATPRGQRSTHPRGKRKLVLEKDELFNVTDVEQNPEDELDPIPDPGSRGRGWARGKGRGGASEAVLGLSRMAEWFNCSHASATSGTQTVVGSNSGPQMRQQGFGISTQASQTLGPTQTSAQAPPTQPFHPPGQTRRIFKPPAKTVRWYGPSTLP